MVSRDPYCTTRPKSFAKGVFEAKIGNFEVFREAIETDATALKQTSNTHHKVAAAVVEEEREKAQKASAVGRTARVATAILSDPDTSRLAKDKSVSTAPVHTKYLSVTKHVDCQHARFQQRNTQQKIASVFLMMRCFSNF